MKVAAPADAAIFRDNYLIKAVKVGPNFLRTVVGITGEVPFADDARSVTGSLEHLGNSNIISRKMLGIVWTKVIGNTDSCRILPRHQRCPVRRTNRGRCVGVGKPHTLARQSVEIGCLVKFVAVASQLTPA
ncbi:hypothetical protein ES703_124438 [subsurface metagenome]